MRVLGFMTGTSLDAVDMAVIETDGEALLALGPAAEVKLAPAARTLVEAAIEAAFAWRAGDPEPAAFAPAATAIANAHIGAGLDFMDRHRLLPEDLDLIGVHGQTVLHEPPGPSRRVGRTVQLIDAHAVASALGVATAYDFRGDD